MTDIKTDCTTRSCEFKAPKDADVEAKLSEIATKENKLEGWSLVE